MSREHWWEKTTRHARPFQFNRCLLLLWSSQDCYPLAMNAYEIVETEETNGDAEENTEQVTISRFRLLLPQVIVSLSCSFMLMLISLSYGFPAMIIGNLLHAKDEFTLNDDQASWLASILFICQPLGCIVSGITVEIMGRRKVLLFLNVPYLISFILLSVASSYAVLLAANALLGITAGFTMAPIAAYFALFFHLAWVLQYLLGALTTWRKAIAICSVVPVISAITLALEPESPTWLVSKNRVEDAERALCWIRGWVKPAAIQQELEILVRYHSESKAQKRSFHNNILLKPQLQNCTTAGEISGTNTEDEKNIETQRTLQYGKLVTEAREMIKPPTLRPLVLIISLTFFINMAGVSAIRSFLFHVCNEFQLPISGEWVLVITSVLGTLGTTVLMLLVHPVGKRPLVLTSIGITSTLTMLFGLYAYLQVDQNQPKETVYSWVPMVLLMAMFFFNSIGAEVNWIIIAEIFPFRTKGKATGLTATSYSVITFLASKTYLDIEKTFRLHGAFWFYGCISVVGFVFLYFRLLETEGRTLEEIEIHFTKGEYPKNVKRTK